MPTNKNKENDYRGLIVVGFSLIGLGVTFAATINPGFIAFVGCGVIFIMIGASRRSRGNEGS
jgi:hypothetical protein